MLSFLPRLPDELDDNTRCECEDCGLVHDAWECEPIKAFNNVLRAGQEVPAGCCPSCGGLSFLSEEEEVPNAQ